MNLENFAEYLKYPSRLYQLPYEELKSLTLQYPYCSNFHVLLLIKSKLEGHPDLEKNLARAATYSIDRKHLRRIMLEEVLIPAESQITIGEDEVLELKDLFSLDEEWEKLPASPAETTREEGSGHLAFDFPAEPDEDLETPLIELEMGTGENSEEDAPHTLPAESFTEAPDLLISSDPLPIIPEDAKDNSDIGIPDAAAVVKPYLLPESLMADLAAVLSITQSWTRPIALPEVTESVPIFQISAELTDTCIATSVVLQDWWDHRENAAVLEWDVPQVRAQPTAGRESKPSVAPTPKSNFQSYKKRYRRPLRKDVPLSAPPPAPADPALPAKKVAEESLREDLGVASETLAGLLVQQHQYDRAIKMYEHLSLLIPEKNTYFAAKIDAIKNL